MFGERALIVRPGLIVGPHDPTGRFTYWARRLERGGEILAPGPPERHAQFVDVRDLATWIVDAVEQRPLGHVQRDERGRSLDELLAGADVDLGHGRLPARARGGRVDGAAALARRSGVDGHARGGRQPSRRGRPPLPAARGDARGRRRRRRPSTASASHPSARPSCSRRGARSESRLPRPRGSAQRRRLRAALPGRGAAGRCRRSPTSSKRSPSGGVEARACCRSRARSSGPVTETHDLLVGLAAVDQRADDHPDPALPRRSRRDPAGRDPHRPLPPGRARPVPAAARLAPRGDRDRGGHDCGRGSAGRTGRRPDRGRDRERARRGAERAGRPRDRRRRPPGGVHPLRRRLDPDAAERAEPNWRIAFSFQTDHRPGALHRAIEPFARHALDLVQLTSRPIPQTPWRYRFDAVVSGHPLDPVVRDTLAEVRPQSQRFTVFGSYPADDRLTTPEPRSRRSSARSRASRSSSTSRRAGPSSSGASRR